MTDIDLDDEATDDAVGLDLSDAEVLERAFDADELLRAYAEAGNPDMVPWERRPGEGEAEWRTFLAYRNQRRWNDVRPRSLSELRAAVGLRDVKVLRAYAEKYEWEARAIAYDNSERYAHEATIRQMDTELILRQKQTALAAAEAARVGTVAAGLAWGTHAQQNGVRLRPDDAARAATAASHMMQNIVRPALPMEARTDAMHVSANVGIQAMTVRVDDAAAAALIDAASRIQDDARPDDLAIYGPAEGHLALDAAPADDIMDGEVIDDLQLPGADPL